MSTDVVVQLRSYLETIETSAPPITVDELEQTNRQLAGPAPESGDDDLTVFDLRHPGESAAPTRRTHRAFVAAAVAAAFVLAVGIVVADRNSSNVVSNAGSSPSVGEPVAPAAPVAPAVADDSSLWSLVSYESGTGLLGVVAGGPGFVAVGGRDGHAAV